jgi:hypothetical protein
MVSWPWPLVIRIKADQSSAVIIYPPASRGDSGHFLPEGHLNKLGYHSGSPVASLDNGLLSRNYAPLR